MVDDALPRLRCADQCELHPRIRWLWLARYHQANYAFKSERVEDWDGGMRFSVRSLTTKMVTTILLTALSTSLSVATTEHAKADSIPVQQESLTAFTPSIKVPGANVFPVGYTAVATVISWRPEPVIMSYQWYADGAAVPAATDMSLVLTRDLAGKQLTFTATGEKSGYITQSRTSKASTPVRLNFFAVEWPWSPRISGNAVVGQTLSAVPPACTPDPQGFTYQWLVDGSVVPDADSETFLLTSEMIDRSVTVTVTCTHPNYEDYSETSEPVHVSLPTFDTVSMPIISGTPKVGATLTAVSGSYKPTPDSLTYAWHARYRGKSNNRILQSGSSSRFVVPLEAVGQEIWVEVSFSKTGYSGGSIESAPTQIIEALKFRSAPEPKVIGTAQVGKELWAEFGKWDPNPGFNIQWYAGATPIRGATDSSFRPNESHVGQAISVSITATHFGYNSVTRKSRSTLPVTSATSAPTDQPLDIYITPGRHDVNGRAWKTECSKYSNTIDRCRTEIYATQIREVSGRFESSTGWVFNNLTYKASPRAQWATNPLGAYGKRGGTAEWVSDGRKWRTECDTQITGRGGCRTYIQATVIDSQQSGGRTYYRWATKEVFNNMVRLSN